MFDKAMFVDKLKKAVADSGIAGFARMSKRDRFRALQKLAAQRSRLVRYAYQHPPRAMNRKQRRSAHHFDEKLQRRGREMAQVPPAQMAPAVRKGLDGRGRTVYASSR